MGFFMVFFFGVAFAGTLFEIMTSFASHRWAAQFMHYSALLYMYHNNIIMHIMPMDKSMIDDKLFLIINDV